MVAKTLNLILGLQAKIETEHKFTIIRGGVQIQVPGKFLLSLILTNSFYLKKYFSQ